MYDLYFVSYFNQLQEERSTLPQLISHTAAALCSNEHCSFFLGKQTKQHKISALMFLGQAPFQVSFNFSRYSLVEFVALLYNSAVVSTSSTGLVRDWTNLLWILHCKLPQLSNVTWVLFTCAVSCSWRLIGFNVGITRPHCISVSVRLAFSLFASFQ